MASYKLLSSPLGDSIKNLDTGEVFPAQPGNAAYDIYAAWVLGGGVAEAADPPAAPGPAEVAQTESEVWFAANAGALALFNLPMATLESELNALIDACLPLATASNKTKLKRLLMAGAVLDRSQVKNSGLG